MNFSSSSTTAAVPVDYSWELTLPTVYGILGIFTVILNGWMTVVILLAKILGQNKFYYMILELAIIDTAVGLTYVQFWAMRYIVYFENLTFDFTQIGCFSFNFVFVFAGPLREFITMAIAIERIYAICSPIHYRLHSGQVTGLALIVTTGASLLLSLGGYLASSNDLMYECSLPLTVNAIYANVWTNLRNATFLLTIAIYVAVIICARLSIRKQNKVKDGAAKLSQGQLKKQRDLTKMVLLLLAAFVGATGTGLILGQIMVSSTDLTFYQYYQWTMISGILDCFNCLANVFIFPLKCEEIRRIIKQNINKTLCGRVVFKDAGITTRAPASSMGKSKITKF